MPKNPCKRLNGIQDDLVLKAVALYDKKEFIDFWNAMDFLDVFLSVKKGLSCSSKK